MGRRLWATEGVGTSRLSCARSKVSCETILGSVTGDRVVNLFADDLVAVGENVFLENGSLILDRLFLPTDVIVSGDLLYCGRSVREFQSNGTSLRVPNVVFRCLGKL